MDPKFNVLFICFLVGLMLVLSLCLGLCLDKCVGLIFRTYRSKRTALPSSQKTKKTSGVQCEENGRRRSFDTSLKEVEGGEEIEDHERLMTIVKGRLVKKEEVPPAPAERVRFSRETKLSRRFVLPVQARLNHTWSHCRKDADAIRVSKRRTTTMLRWIDSSGKPLFNTVLRTSGTDEDFEWNEMRGYIQSKRLLPFWQCRLQIQQEEVRWEVVSSGLMISVFRHQGHFDIHRSYNVTLEHYIKCGMATLQVHEAFNFYRK